MAVTSLGPVRAGLFATIAEAGASLEHFSLARQDAPALQRGVEALQQLAGTLRLLQLEGAELLARELHRLATDIPAAAGQARDGQLAALGSGLFVLRRYLECVEAQSQEMPELLLPALNEVRAALAQPALPESFFFSVHLERPRPPVMPGVACGSLASEGRRLRQMYQTGLLALLRGQASAGLRLMERALARLDACAGHGERSRLCWLGAAALESLRETPLRLTPARHRLLARLDGQLRQMLADVAFTAPRALLKELLYLVALGGGSGVRGRELRAVFALPDLPCSDALLAEAAQRLAGPGREVLASLARALGEELDGLHDLLDQLGRDASPEAALAQLPGRLECLGKTLGMVGVGEGATLLQALAAEVAGWSQVDGTAVARLAEALLQVEDMIGGLSGPAMLRPRLAAQRCGTRADDLTGHQVQAARAVVFGEIRGLLARAVADIAAYLQRHGDRSCLSGVPLQLHEIAAVLRFLALDEAAALLGRCAGYVQERLLGIEGLPDDVPLATLADALSSLEVFLETGPDSEEARRILDLSSDSVRALCRAEEVAR